MYGVLFIISMVVLVFGIVAVIAAIAFHVTWMYTVYAGLAALLFMVYLAVDIQVIFEKLGESTNSCSKFWSSQQSFFWNHFVLFSSHVSHKLWRYVLWIFENIGVRKYYILYIAFVIFFLHVVRLGLFVHHF